MKNTFVALLLLGSISSCKFLFPPDSQGELMGVRSKKKQFYPEKPHGMVEIPGGSFIMGSSDEDLVDAQNDPTKTVTVRSFYMDDTEISNAEYRAFVEWVKDSIVRTQLAVAAVEEAGYDFPTEKELDQDGILQYFPKFENEEEKTGAYEEYLDEYSFGSNILDNWLSTYQAPDSVFHYHLPLNKDVDIIWDRDDYPDLQYAMIIEDSIYLPEEEWFNGEPTTNKKMFKYRFSYFDAVSAIKNPDTPRSKFWEYEVVEVYPDTTVWIKDFKYSYNEPVHNNYFWHKAYADYPVVGITWAQATAFAHWRTKMRNDYLRNRKKKDIVPPFRLPTEVEWEYAARGGLESAIYPWGGPYLVDDRGEFLANFKPKRGDYAADCVLYTAEVYSFPPNDYGLYNMSGNVAEWTETPYYDEAYEFAYFVNPKLVNSDSKRRVVRGGSWKDVSYFLKVATRDYEYADSARSYIGFRTVRDFVGNTDIR